MLRRVKPGRIGVTTTSLALLVLAPSGSDAQDPAQQESGVYLAAADFLRELGSASVVDEYRCDTRWLRLYGVPIRCRASPFRTPLRLVAEDQGVPLVDRVPECGPERDGRSLQLSPVQYDAADAAWFIVALACGGAEGLAQQLFLVEVRRIDARWVLERSRLLESRDRPQADTLVVTIGTDASARSLQLIEEMRLGALDGPVEQTFGFINDIAVAEDGTLYVPDIQVPAVRVFDSGGRYAGDLGGEGQGPGEFTTVRGITTLPTGEVAVWHEMDRVTIFGAAGEYRSGFSMRLSSIAGGPGQSMFTDSVGNLVVRTTTRLPTTSPPLAIPYAWVRCTPRGELVDSLLPPDREIAGPPPVFRTETFSRPSPHGYLVSGRNSSYSLVRPLADGRVLRIEREPTRIRLEGEERDQWQAYLNEWDSRRGTSSPALPAEKPPWKQIDIDAEGRIWVLRYSDATKHPDYVAPSVQFEWPNVNVLEPVRYDIIDPRGAYLGTVTFPHHARFRDARGDRVWVLERGELDEFYVVRYRMAPPPGPS